LITVWDCLNSCILGFSTFSFVPLFFWVSSSSVGIFWFLLSYAIAFLSFFASFLAFFEMARTKITSKPPPNIDYKALCPWASVGLLAETSTLTSYEDTKKHRQRDGEDVGRAFGKEHDTYVSVRPCALGEHVCADDRVGYGEPFFFLYATIFKRIKLRLPFLGFERALLTEINVAPAQLHPNS